MDLALLQKDLRQFAAEREWEPFHTPKNFAMALMVEAAELAEIFQWMTPEQSQNVHSDKVLQERVGDEVADVLLYLLQLADHCAIDLKRAVGRKLIKNAKKHPPIKSAPPAQPTAIPEAPMHVLVDWENVQPKSEDIQALVPGVTHVWIFHGKNQKKVDAHHAAFGDNLTLVPISRPGKNALDFHLSFYVGYITSRNPSAQIAVISNDQGYGPILDHAQDLGFVASQLGFKKPLPAPKKSAAKKKGSTKKAPAKAVATKSKAEPATARKKASAKKTAAKTSAAKPAAQTASLSAFSEKDYLHVVKSLEKNKNKPTRKARLHGMVKSLVEGGSATDKTVEAVVARLVAEQRVQIDDKGAVTFVAAAPDVLTA